jgi:hypothetical protein
MSCQGIYITCLSQPSESSSDMSVHSEPYPQLHCLTCSPASVLLVISRFKTVMTTQNKSPHTFQTPTQRRLRPGKGHRRPSSAQCSSVLPNFVRCSLPRATSRAREAWPRTPSITRPRTSGSHRPQSSRRSLPPTHPPPLGWWAPPCRRRSPRRPIHSHSNRRRSPPDRVGGRQTTRLGQRSTPRGDSRRWHPRRPLACPHRPHASRR